MADHKHTAEELAPYTEQENKIHFLRESDWTQCPGYLFGQEDNAGIGMVVIQEWWGVNHQIIDVAKFVAEQGFRTLVPDLYRGKVAIDHENAGHLMNGLNWIGAVEDIKGAVKYLKATGSRKVVVIGFCMGGALSLASAARIPDVDAAVPFYGIPPAQLADVSTIRVPVLAHFGELDSLAGFSDPQAARELEEKLRAGKVDHEVVMHAGVGHGFVNPIHHAPQAVIDAAWARTFAFVRRRLDVAAIGRPAPDWSEEALLPNGEFGTVRLGDYRGRYLVVLFYPLDFTFVCPTELVGFSDRLDEFHAADADIVAASVDSKYAHLAWTRAPRRAGGLGGTLRYPLVADLRQRLARDYGVLIDGAGHTLRGLFIINPEGVVVHITKNDCPVGRSVDEALRLVHAFRYVAEHGEVCPVNWTPGAATMKPDPQASRAYFEKAAGFGSSLSSSSSSSPSSLTSSSSSSESSSSSWAPQSTPALASLAPPLPSEAAETPKPTATTRTTLTPTTSSSHNSSGGSSSSGWLASANLPVIIAGALVGVAVLVGSKKLYDLYTRRR